jgi:tyrosine decarboxylase
MVLRLYGVENLQSYIRKHIELAKYFEELVISDSRFEVKINQKPTTFQY